MIKMRVALVVVAAAAISAASEAVRPHIIFFMVDDFGWNDVGYHYKNSGGPANDIQTPHIDSLVQEGVELDRHYAFQWCTPSRSSFLSGRLPVHIEWNNGNVCNANEGIPRNMTAIATQLGRVGYVSHQLGKWDAGMSTPTHTPQGRGFKTSLGYFDHENDYFNYRPQTPFNNSHGPCSATAKIRDLWDTDHPAAALADGTYEEAILFRRATEIITTHDPTIPLFLYYAFHIGYCNLPLCKVHPAEKVHAPLEVTDEWLNKYAFIKDSATRRSYHAMVAYMDEVVGNVTRLVKDRGMWGDTVVVMSSDNGGPIYAGGGGNNYPLKGGKISDWEGGVRVNAWVSGGFLPPQAVGTKVEGLMHLADWYATFCHLAGIDTPTDPVAEAAGLPPIDSLNMWPVITGANKTSPRHSLHVSPYTLIQGEYKVIVGASVGVGLVGGPTDQNGWTGPVFPNASSGKNGEGGLPGLPQDCRRGCLYNIYDDPNEYHELSVTHPDILSSMLSAITALNASVYRPPAVPNDIRCCTVALDQNGGFLGPFLP